MIPKTTTSVYNNCRDARNEEGEATIRSKDVAVLVRNTLKATFPATKFRVRSDYNSVDIFWTDGPTSRQVDEITQQYTFGGFDGMIDMAYCSKNWLLANGTMKPAASTGTQGSMGTVAAYATDCPEPGAVLVKYGPRYVFTHRERSPELEAKLLTQAEQYYGFKVPEGVKPWNYNVPAIGEWASTLMHRYETRHAATAE